MRLLFPFGAYKEEEESSMQYAQLLSLLRIAHTALGFLLLRRYGHKWRIAHRPKKGL